MGVKLKAPLAGVTTLGNQAIADRLIVVRSVAELRFAQRLAECLDEPLRVLGGGSNVIASPRVTGIVAQLRLRGRQIVVAGTHRELVLAAGESWHESVRFSLGQGFKGLERLVLIPGSVGAAPIQNIGAYGGELSDTLSWVEALDRTSGRVERLTAADCEFGYRDSLFRRPGGERWIILRLALRLEPGVSRPVAVPSADRYPDVTTELERLGGMTPTAVLLAEAILRVRRRKLPDWRQVGNVGSVFKNPMVSLDHFAVLQQQWPGLKGAAVSSQRVRLAAAQLIDLAGLKQCRIGLARPWHRQPLVLTLAPRGQSDGRDFVDLLATVAETVATCFNVRLELEPRILGAFDTDKLSALAGLPAPLL